MKQPDQGFTLSCNAQISTDAAHGLIVGVAVTQEANDSARLLPAVDRLEQRLEKKPQQTPADRARAWALGKRMRGCDLLLEGDAETPLPIESTRMMSRRPRFLGRPRGARPATSARGWHLIYGVERTECAIDEVEIVNRGAAL